MNEPHPNALIIKAWAEGHPIQWRFVDSPVWRDLAKSETPTLPQSEVRYRIKPEDDTRYWRAYMKTDGALRVSTVGRGDLEALTQTLENAACFYCWLNDWQPL